MEPPCRYCRGNNGAHIKGCRLECRHWVRMERIRRAGPQKMDKYDAMSHSNYDYGWINALIITKTLPIKIQQISIHFGNSH